MPEGNRIGGFRQARQVSRQIAMSEGWSVASSAHWISGWASPSHICRTNSFAGSRHDPRPNRTSSAASHLFGAVEGRPSALNGTAQGAAHQEGPPMSRANAALTPRHRLIVARVVVEDGYPISEVAARFQSRGAP